MNESVKRVKELEQGHKKAAKAIECNEDAMRELSRLNNELDSVVQLRDEEEKKRKELTRTINNQKKNKVSLRDKLQALNTLIHKRINTTDLC